MNKTITLVAAMGRNRGIGLRGRMPWHLPAELQHFKKTTMGKPIVMGRKTWESIGRPLPGRQNIVISRSGTYQAVGCSVADSLVEAVEMAEGYEVMIIGGGELYAQSMPLASRMVLTMVDCELEADTWFPAWDTAGWQLVDSVVCPPDQSNEFGFEVNQWLRSQPAGLGSAA